MKRLGTVAALCLVLCTGCSIPDAQENDTTAWQTAYQQVLREKAGSPEGQFALIPLDGDEIPELLINLDNVAYLYKCSGTEAVCIEEWNHLMPAAGKMVSFQPGRETIAHYTYSMANGRGCTVYLLQDLEMADDRYWIFDMGYMSLEYMELDADKFDVEIVEGNFFELGDSWVNGETDPDLLKGITEENLAALDTIWETTGAAYLTKE